MISSIDARKALQLLQYSIQGMAEVIVNAGLTKDNAQEVVVDASTCVLRSCLMLDYYLTHSVSVRKTHLVEDSASSINLISSMKTMRYQLSREDMALTIRWPRVEQTKDIVLIHGDDEDVLERWEALFS